MVSLRILIVIAIVAVVFPPTLTKELVVGDDKGWTINFDYQAGPRGKISKSETNSVLFKYPEGVHNVFEVDKTAFQQCVAPATTEALATGNDVITLATPGRKWYICGVGKHCEARNQKLAITVYPLLGSLATSPSGGGAPSSTPASAGSGITISKYHAWMLAAFGILMIMV